MTSRTPTWQALRPLIPTVLAAACIAALSVASLFFLPAAQTPHAQAAPIGSSPKLGSPEDVLGPGRWHKTDRGKTWYGAYRSLTNTLAYCVDAGLSTPYPRYFEQAQGELIDSPQTAWALHTYAESEKRDVHSALSALVKLDEAVPHRHVIEPRNPADLGKDFSGSADQFTRISAAAKSAAGPYTLRLELDELVLPVEVEALGGSEDSSGSDERDGSEDSSGSDELDRAEATTQVRVSVESAAGTLLPDVQVELTADSGTLEQQTVTTGDQPVSVPIAVTGSGTVKVDAHADDLPATQVRFHEATNTGAQRVQNVVTTGPPTTIRSSAERSFTVPSNPQVSTKITNERPAPGTAVTDDFTLSGLAPEQTVDVEHILWASPHEPERRAEPHQEAFELGRVTSEGVSNGTHTSDGVMIPEDFRGWVYWTETIAGDKDTQSWRSEHGIPEETGFVEWTPSASTQALIDPEEMTSVDTIRITGAQPDSQLAVTAAAYFVADRPVRSSQPQGRELGSQEIDVHVDSAGVAELATEPVTVPTAEGWVTWVVTIADTEHSAAWTSDWGVPEETVEIPTSPASPPAADPSTDEPSASPSATDPTPAHEQSRPSSAPSVDSLPVRTTVPRSETDTAPPAAEPESHVESPVPAEPAGASAPDTLPRTGVRAAGLIGLALVLMGTGIGALAFSSRRNDQQ